MSCTDVGAPDSEIAGFGIILAFAIQGFISVLSSAWSLFLVVKRGNVHAVVDQARKDLYSTKIEIMGKVQMTAANAQVVTGMWNINFLPNKSN